MKLAINVVLPGNSVAIGLCGFFPTFFPAYWLENGAVRLLSGELRAGWAQPVG